MSQNIELTDVQDSRLTLQQRHGTPLTRRRICFVSNPIYPLLADVSVPRIGGAEVQQSIIGRCLRDNGHDVSFVTKVFEDRRDDELIDGMHIYKTCATEDGVPLVRYFHPRLSSIWQAMKRADADIYYQRCADRATGLASMFCQKYGRKFVFSGAHDSDFYKNLELGFRERMLYRRGLRNADVVLVQSEQQRRLLKQNYGIDGHQLSNVYPNRELSQNKGYVLWVGNMREFKRPLMCVELARKFPAIQFIMIGGVGSGSEELYRQVESAELPNLKFLGFQPLHVTERYFDEASLLLNTSTVEGFPNTYLQAWSRGIPVLGTFDPNGLIAEHDLGRVVTDVSEFGSWFDKLLACSGDERQRIQNVFEERFAPQHYVDSLFDIVDGAKT